MINWLKKKILLRVGFPLSLFIIAKHKFLKLFQTVAVLYAKEGSGDIVNYSFVNMIAEQKKESCVLVECI